MRVIAVDPGLTIGLAYYDSTVEHGWLTWQGNNPQDAAKWIYDIPTPRSAHLIVENFISGGHLTSEAKETIKLVGFFEYWGAWLGFPTKLVVPQKRLSAVSQATQLLGSATENMHRNGRDAIAALAHAISYAREVG